MRLDRIEARLAGYVPKHARFPGLRPSAVLIPLFTHPADGSTFLWLMRRTEDGTAHSGQVALPGGKVDPQDTDIEATALREAHEELGLRPESVRVLGRLDDYVTITGYRITPIVGEISPAFVPMPDAREVARAFEVPLATFFGPGERHSVTWSVYERVVPAYRVGGEVVWGATLAIMQKFADLLR